GGQIPVHMLATSSRPQGVRCDLDTMTLHAVFIDIDAQPRAIQDISAAVADTDRTRRHILAQADISQCQSPGDLGDYRRNVQSGRAGDARLTGLAGDVDAHAEAITHTRGFDDRTHAAQLDSLEAHAACGLAFVMAANVRRRVNAFV